MSRLARRGRNREARNIVLVAVEGETERTYFEAMRERDSNVQIIMARPGKADPIRLVKACIRTMDEKEVELSKGDLAICVFDVDENPLERMKEAIELAEETGIIVALSNPCFELWLALHFQDVHHPIDRIGARELMEKRLGGYSKTADYRSVLIPLRPSAVGRAVRLQRENGIKETVDCSMTNPSTSMHRAVGAIEELMRHNRSKRECI